MPERRALGACPICRRVMWADDVNACTDCDRVVCGDCSTSRPPLDFETPDPLIGAMPACLECWQPRFPFWRRMFS